MADETRGETVDENNLEQSENFEEIQEGKAKILFPKSNTVFYNNVQVFNRDISIAIIKKFRKTLSSTTKKTTTQQQETNEVTTEQLTNSGCEINILEALSATGLRAVRYALEIPGLKRIVANDLSQEAVSNIKRNIQHNNVKDKVESSHSDASLLMYEHRYPSSKRFQVIDLDPYGSPSQFLDGAVQALDDGGLLCVTCTDMGGLCGNHGEAAYAKYGGMPLKAKYCHEMALRIVLASIDTHAGRYKRYIQPVVSLSADFYIRVFVRIFTSASEVKRSASKKSYVFHCCGCETFHLQPVGKSVEVGNSKKYNPATGPITGKECDECGHIFKIGGPIWSQPMHDQAFIRELLAEIELEKECYATFDRMMGVLSVMLEELNENPLYFVLDNLCNIIHSTTPSHAQFRSALLHAGYKVSSTHCNEIGMKTDAPVAVLWDILRCWVKLHPVNSKKVKERSPALRLLQKEPIIDADFTVLPEAIPNSKKLKLSRFPVNPEADWGPKARAKQSSKQFASLDEKRKTLQGKRSVTKAKLNHKEFPCKKFKRGECDRGDDCKYSHQIDETLTRNT